MADLYEANEILDILGSNEDPIWFNGAPTDIRELSGLYPDTNIHKIWIQFYGESGKGLKKRRGTVYSMILDRLG